MNFEEKDLEKIQRAGINTDEKDRSGSYVMSDDKPGHVSMRQEGVEMMQISEALEKYPHYSKLMWNLVNPEKDEYTKDVHSSPPSGYFILVRKDVKAFMPFQACFFLKQDKIKQKVHNLIILEENSEIHILNGCAAASYIAEGSHVGITEMYIGKNAKLTYTMIHDWAANVSVRPRSAVKVEENGSYISNYIALRETKITQMAPWCYLDGKNALAKFNSLILAPKGSVYDLGANVELNAEGAKAEIINRSVSRGGDAIARGKLAGNSPGIKAHLECDGLMLSDKGKITAIPELESSYRDVDMSHEAAIGKVDQEQILYLMSRGISEQDAVSAIVSGFMDVGIFGLPPALEAEVKKTLSVIKEGAM